MNIWVLVDNKTGSSKQSLALASIMNWKYEVKEVKYTFWAKLPNFIPMFNHLIIDQKTKKNLLLGKPDVIIGAGRRLAKVMIYLKRKYPSVKLVQILKPHLPLKNFDALILPHHDNINLSPIDKRKKIIRVNGALGHYNEQELMNLSNQWTPHFDHLNKPQIALFVGGSAKGCKMENKHIVELAELTIALAKKINGSLLITNSRRTNFKLSKLLFSLISKSDTPAKIFDARSAFDNPYKGYLACADYIIVTGDSISMCVESINTRKPVLVYCPKAMVSKKHWRFIDQLLKDKQITLLQNFELNQNIPLLDKNEDIKLKLMSLLKI